MATKSNKILKRIGYSLLVIMMLLVIGGFIVVRKFNNSWFRDRPNYLSYTSESKAMNFEWAKETYGAYTEQHVALLIPVRIEGLPQQFYVQFDTGAPNTLIYGKTIESIKKMGVDLEIISENGNQFVKQLNLIIGGNATQMTMPVILPDYGRFFEANDTTSRIHIGTIGADFIDQRITEIDFKNQKIQCYDERPDWMKALADFQPFSFKGRRIMFPAEIDEKNLELLYDSGCSAFGLITSKNRYDKYTDNTAKEIAHEGNRFGESLPIFHKDSHSSIAIGSADLPLKRISYVGIYADFQGLMSPFTNIGGFLGNKPFLDNTLIIDTKKEEFIIIEPSMGH